MSSPFSLAVLCALLACASGCATSENPLAFAVGKLDSPEFLDVIGPSDEDTTVVRREMSKSQHGVQVVEEEVSRGPNSPKKALPLGRVAYQIFLDATETEVVEDLMGTRRIMLRLPFRKDAAEWTNSVQVASPSPNAKAAERCHIVDVSTRLIADKERRSITTECTVGLPEEQLVTTSQYVDGMGMVTRRVEAGPIGNRTRLLQITARNISAK